MKKFTMTNIHSLGNGRVCAYCEGAGIADWIGPYYSAPTLARLLPEGDSLCSRRSPGTGVWTHTLTDGTVLTDITLPGLPAVLRRVRGWTAFGLQPVGVKKFVPVPEGLLSGSRFAAAVFGYVPCGTLFYKNWILPSGEAQGYPTPDRICALVAVTSGSAEVAEDGSARLICRDGELLLLAARDEQALWQAFGQIDARPFDGWYAACLADWQTFTDRRLKKASPMTAELAQVADDVAVLLRTQQDASGGVLAGCNYHLSYVRDNFGVFRGLLAAGCLEEARALMDFYVHTFARYGRVQTAQGMGVEAFHVHEHDFAENTGYLALMAAELADAEGNPPDNTLPLLRYVLALQHAHLAGGVLPFSGDETYIAGGILPRSCISDGSMEATLLYHRALELLLPGAERWLDRDTAAAYHGDLRQIGETFPETFLKDGILWCNAPGAWTEQERMRPGVRECGHGFGLSYRNSAGRYVCMDCLRRDDLPAVPPRRYDLLSTAFTPLYVGSGLVPETVLRRMVDAAAAEWSRTGRLPSGKGDRSVGYDFGMLLLALKRLNGEDERIRALEVDTLAHRDGAGAWVEYYDAGLPAGTPCRPWESAVNLFSLVLPVGKGNSGLQLPRK